jgi:hypothetical protein
LTSSTLDDIINISNERKEVLSMKCALEMLKIQQETRQLWELEQQRQDEECRQEYLQTIQNTIDFCEIYLQEQLEKQARQLVHEPTTISVEFKIRLCSDRLKHNLFQELRCQGQLYADGRYSYTHKEKLYDLDILIKYLSEHCFTVEQEDFSYFRYGCGGGWHGKTITVSVKV